VDPELIKSIYKEFIIPITKEVEVIYLLQRLTSCSGSVAYTAPEGSVAHQAVHSFFGTAVSDQKQKTTGEGGTGVTALNCADTAEVFGAVMSNKAGFGVVPFESTVAGIGTDTKRLLIESGLLVYAEIVMEVTIILLSLILLSDTPSSVPHTLSNSSYLPSSSRSIGSSYHTHHAPYAPYAPYTIHHTPYTIHSRSIGSSCQILRSGNLAASSHIPMRSASVLSGWTKM
jgi:chorismate mutase